jgi:para-aminobenzoate synthetase component 1
MDHIAGRAWVSAIGAPENDPKAARRVAEERAELLADALATGGQGQAPFDQAQGGPAEQGDRRACEDMPALQIMSNFTHGDYLQAVRRAKDYIAAGDIYQVNLSQRMSAPLATTPMSLYRRLTQENPAPFSAYLETPDAAIVCCSPERFLQVRSDEVETRPIKGTRPRGSTPEEDARLAAELLASEKDRAENVMIVDLERNDLGRVCEYGSVHVPELFALESYATVHHLVSTVRGRLRPGATALDCLRASFPGGSITGAPKVRAMEIIEELERTRRGVYTGAIGYLCFSGDMDVNIVIRTLVVRDGTAYFQVGGAIVADSDPEGEYQETLDKARALARGLAAEAGTETVQWPG